MNNPINSNPAERFLTNTIGVDVLVGSRALTFGGAGASLAIILLIAQIKIDKPVVDWSLGFAAVAFPLWLALALSYDIWLALKLDLHDLHSFKWLHKVQACWFYLTGLITCVSITLLVSSLHKTIWTLFVAACLLGLALFVVTLRAASYRILLKMAREPVKCSNSHEV
jgi:hypothetical protein